MRKSYRPLIDCGKCGAKIHTILTWPDYSDEKVASRIVQANWSEPPGPSEKCPKCAAEVDTTNAYPFIPDFPPKFEQLKKAYEGFIPKSELQRQSFERIVDKFLSASTFADCEAGLNSEEGLAWFRQRMFYRSGTTFYRALQLFLGYLTLDHHNYKSWADVTAYYSRFFFIQAFLNLLLSTYLNLGRQRRAFIFFDGARIICTEQDNLPSALNRKGSHDMWWALMEALKSPDYPCDNLDFILSSLVYNPEQRQTTNYDLEYLGGGFIELDWFDSGWKQMLNHFSPTPRRDQDITNEERFFEGYDPENADIGDFMGDSAQIIWSSLV